MTIRRFPWRLPRPEKDQSYNNFIRPDNSGAEKLFKLLPGYARPVISQILKPDPTQRCTLEDVLADDWVKRIETCTPDRPAVNHPHHLLIESSKMIMNRGNIIVLNSQRREEDAGSQADKKKKAHEHHGKKR
jgi:serine/threonine protein kinase